VTVDAGRLPRACASDVCEGLSLTGRHRIGERVRLGPTVVVVVGRGSLDPATLPDRSLLGRRALLLRSVPRSLRLFARTRVGTSVVATAPLDPERVPGSGLRALVERLRPEVAPLAARSGSYGHSRRSCRARRDSPSRSAGSSPPDGCRSGR